jgi:7,8-dihydro-6-hydroxymethylpterin dimethyltransferase
MADALLRTTTGLCGQCKRSVGAELWRVDDRVVMRKRCEAHGAQEVLISSSAAWYEEVMREPTALSKPSSPRPVARGCPFDCGPCTQHEQKVLLPIVPITSSCNLDCPICYTHNKNAGPYQMSEDELRAILRHLRAADPERRIINLTGGEPTQHPSFERLVELCQEEGIHRVTISTHGLRFLKDEWLLEKLAALGARVVLSFDSLRPEPNAAMLGGAFLEAKLRVLALLEKYQVDTTLLPVLARGQNDEEVGAFVRLGLEKDFIRSVELHTMTFTGQGGAQFDRAARYTPFDVLTDLERQTGGVLRVSDFTPSPAAHPLCYQVTYLLRLDGGGWLPFPRFMSRADLRSLLGGSLYLELGPDSEQLLEDVVNRLWSGAIACEEAPAVLSTLKRLLRELFAPGVSAADRLRICERHSKAVYLHAHMDEETFDTDRIRQCCVGIREPDGTNVPSCAYNVLYRERDHRFATAPAAPLAALGPGRLG